MMDLDAIGRASSYSLDALVKLRVGILNGLYFDNFLERHGFAALGILIPKNKKYGEINPLAAYIQTGAAVRFWRTIGRGDRLHIINNPPMPVTHSSSR